MNLFDVYPLFDVNIVRGKGCRVWDDKGTEYLDLYGGHAVISIGHAHPHYVRMISEQFLNSDFIQIRSSTHFNNSWPNGWDPAAVILTIAYFSSTAAPKPMKTR
jgi:acetylornithine/succinyldiaminopimelate/putrescine aminotransferase